MTEIISFAAFCFTFSTSPAMICFFRILEFFSPLRPLGSQISSHQGSQHTFGPNNYFWPECQVGMPLFLILKFPLRLSKSACWELGQWTRRGGGFDHQSISVPFAVRTHEHGLTADILSKSNLFVGSSNGSSLTTSLHTSHFLQQYCAHLQVTKVYCAR